MAIIWIRLNGKVLWIVSQGMQSRFAKFAFTIMREKVKFFQLLHPIRTILPLMLQDRVQLKRYAIDSSGMRVEL